MKKNYTLKLVLAMLIVVLVSLVSFVGVYKGKNLLKGYTLGKDFSQRKVATYSIVQSEEQSSEDNQGQASEETDNATEEGSQEDKNSTESENKDTQANEPVSEEQKKENYKNAKNNISKRLTAMKSEEYDIRLDDETGKLVIEAPADLNSTYLSQIVSKGKVQIKNTSTNEIIVDGNGFKDASTKMDTTTYSKPIVVITLKFTNDAKKKINETSSMYNNEEGQETEASFAVTLDGETLYTDKASTFIDSANNGQLDLVLGQSDEGEALQEDYQRALAITAIIKCGEIPVEYEIEALEIVSSNIKVKTIVIVAIIIGIAIFIFDIIKCNKKAILPAISLIGYVALVLLVLRYTNVKITLFTALAILLVTLLNNSVIVKTLSEKKSFNETLIKEIVSFIPCLIIAIVFCCAPYLQLASFGMAIFWGVIVMCIYNALITRIFVEK